MFKFTLSSIALLGLVSFASAQTNINRIQGNGNTVINRSVGGTASNFNKINGNGNTIVNRSQPAPAPIPAPVGRDRSSWSPVPLIQPAPFVVAPQRVQYVESSVEYYQEPSAPVCEGEVYPTPYVVAPPMEYVGQPMFRQPLVRPTPSPMPAVNLNLNLNQINGNNNRVVNSTTGGSGLNLNVNRINGNGNTVVNRSRP